MDDLGILLSPFGIAIVAVGGGIFMVIVSTMFKARIRELEIRERIAMIERGMVPPPESDPAGFERRMRMIHHVQDRPPGPRFRSGGIMVISVGFGLMTLLWFVGVPREAVGIGGFLVFIGLGLLLNSLLSSAPPPLPAAMPQPGGAERAPEAQAGGAVSSRPHDQP